jgi:multicomponent Na+:H+ antiporter subunit D
LQIVLPLLLAPVCVLLRGARLAWFTALTASWAAFGIAVALLLDVLAGGPISSAVGGWNAPWGIELRVDAANAFVLTIVAGIGAVVMIFARKSVEQEIGNARAYLFYATYLLCLAGLLGVTITGDAFNLFVFLEISSLSSYVLISLGKDRRALYAAYQYLILGTIGATFYLIGVGLLYQVTGTLNMMDLAQRIEGQEGLRGVRVAFAFLTVGISLKLALFPLHFWLPNAYAYAPSAVTGFMAATATKVSVYVLLRVFFTIFGVEFSFGQMPLGEILMILAVAAMFAASTVAIFQNNVKRMLAYSSVAQIGYIVLGISMASVTGVQAGVLHLFNHALIKGGLFLAMGCIAYRIGSTHIRDLAGLGKRMPLRGRRVRPDRHPHDRRFHQQMVSGAGRAGAGLVVDRHPDPAQLAAGRALCLEGGRANVFHARGRRGGARRGAARPAGPHLDPDYRQHLVRYRHAAFRGRRA